MLGHVIDGVQSADDALFLWEKLFCEIAEEHAPTKLKRVKGQKHLGSAKSCWMLEMNVTITIVKHAVLIVHTIGICAKNCATMLIERTAD